MSKYFLLYHIYKLLYEFSMKSEKLIPIVIKLKDYEAMRKGDDYNGSLQHSTAYLKIDRCFVHFCTGMQCSSV